MSELFTITSTGIADLLRYLLVCTVVVCAGVGLVQMVGVPLGRVTRMLIAPLTTHAFWAITLGIGVIAGVTVRGLALPLWLATILLALYGAWTIVREARGKPVRPLVALLAVCALVPLIPLLPDSLAGLSSYGGYASDGWSYVAYGSYLWSIPRGVEGGLSPIYQWAAHLSTSRFISSAELGLLSGLWRSGDTQAAEGLLVALTLFSLACVYAAFVFGFGLSDTHVLLCVGVMMLSGWMLSVLQADNYDYAAALVYFSGLAATIRDEARFTWRRWGLLGFLSTGLYYTYPELVLVILACAAVFLTERLLRQDDRAHLRRDLPKGVLAAIAIAAVLGAPYFKDSFHYFGHQAVTALTMTDRPGEGYFPGLLVPARMISGFWALGGEFLTTRMMRLQLPIGVALFGLMLVGLIHLVRRGAWSVAVINVVLTAGAFVFIVRYAYAYGAYKFIVFNWGLMILAAFLGVRTLGAPGTLLRRALFAGGVLLMLAIPVVLAVRLVRIAPKISAQAVVWFRPVEHVRDVVGEAPIGIAAEDDLNSYWAVYYLRDHPIQLLQFPNYLAMAHVQPYLARAPVIPAASIRFLLTDTVDPGPLVEVEGWTRLWRQGRYTLWDTAATGWALVQTVESPNGIERVNGRSFLWLGGGRTSIRITANRAGPVRLAGRFIVGPNLPAETASLHLQIDNSRGFDRVQTIAPGLAGLCLPVAPGTTTWTLTPLDRAVASRQPSGDVRQRLVGLEAPTLQWAPAAAGTVDGC